MSAYAGVLGVTVTSISGDNKINLSESSSSVPIVGAFSGLGAGAHQIAVRLYNSANAVVLQGYASVSGDSGTWSLVLPPAKTALLANGNYTVGATFGAFSAAPLAFIIDKTPPSAPTISAILDNVGAVQGTVLSGKTTDDATPTLRVALGGTGAQVGDTVQIYNSGSAIATSGLVTLIQANLDAGYVDITLGTGFTPTMGGTIRSPPRSSTQQAMSAAPPQTT